MRNATAPLSNHLINALSAALPTHGNLISTAERSSPSSSFVRPRQQVITTMARLIDGVEFGAAEANPLQATGQVRETRRPHRHVVVQGDHDASPLLHGSIRKQNCGGSVASGSDLSGAWFEMLPSGEHAQKCVRVSMLGRWHLGRLLPS